jgi:hypothetical protein
MKWYLKILLLWSAERSVRSLNLLMIGQIRASFVYGDNGLRLELLHSHSK